MTTRCASNRRSIELQGDRGATPVDSRAYCEVELLNALNAYIARGGRVIIYGELDRRNSVLAETNDGGVCVSDQQVSTNAVMTNLPALIDKSVRRAQDGNQRSSSRVTRRSMAEPGRQHRYMAEGAGERDGWYHDAQLRLSAKPGARVLARYKRVENRPSSVRARRRQTIGNVSLSARDCASCRVTSIVTVMR